MMYAQKVQNQLSRRYGEAQNLVVHILTSIRVVMSAKSHMAMVTLRTNSITKHALDSMKPILTTFALDLVQNRSYDHLVFSAVKGKRFIQLKQLR